MLAFIKLLFITNESTFLIPNSFLAFACGHITKAYHSWLFSLKTKHHVYNIFRYFHSSKVNYHFVPICQVPCNRRSGNIWYQRFKNSTQTQRKRLSTDISILQVFIRWSKENRRKDLKQNWPITIDKLYMSLAANNFIRPLTTLHLILSMTSFQFVKISVSDNCPFSPFYEPLILLGSKHLLWYHTIHKDCVRIKFSQCLKMSNTSKKRFFF